MDHEQYRQLFPQYPPLPDDKIVYGPHPIHGNWYKPQWNASQMIPDQNKDHKLSPRWTNANMVGDLGAYGRYQEAKQLAGVDHERNRRNNSSKPLHPRIEGSVLRTLRNDAIHTESQSVWTDTSLKACVAIMGQGLFAGIGYGILHHDVMVGIARLGFAEALALGPLATQAIVRRNRMNKLSEDVVIAGDEIISKNR